MNRRYRPVLEELEPRILFSADLAALTGAHLLDTADVRPIAPTNSTNLANSVESGLVLAARHEVVFVDTSVDDWETLVGDIDTASGKNTLDVVLIDARRDGIDQISTALADRQAIDAIHIISHGSDGMLQLGTTQLDSTTLSARANQIQGWERALSSEADILLYGCDVARTADGQAFVARLGTLTGTDVAASSDKTGNAVQGGNWQFEYKVGSIETQSVAGATEPTQWSGTLAITSNGTVTSTQTTSATSLTWSHTVSAGSNRVLVVELAIDGLGAPASSVTYGGVALTQIGRGTGNHAVELWALINPTVGTANVVASFSGTTAAAGGASTFNGVAQTIGTAFGTFVSATGTGTTASVTASSAVGEQVIDVLYWRNSPATSATLGAGQTANWSQTNTTMGGGSSLEAGATSVVMSSNLSGSVQWEIAAVSMKTAAGITVTPTSGLTTTEAGGTANFSVVLDSAPTANVTIALSSSDSSEGTLSTGSLTFTTANWSTPQTVTVTGVDDSFIDGNIAYSIVTPAASSADARYNGLNASDVSLTNTDNDTVNTLYVDTTSDTVDGTVTSIASLLANKGADGKISLREAITAANNTANGVGGADVINFNIAGTGIHTINLASALPSITGAVTINAASDDSFTANGNRPAIVLNGGGSIQDGLDLVGGSDGSTIRGFIMQNFATVAISVGTSNGNTIAGNWLGLDSSGTSAASNGAGIELWNANNNVVGGTTAADRNVISGSTTVGMAINTNNGTSTGNLVIGNYFGTNAAGTAAVGNTNQALWVNAANNTIGGATAGAGNVISGTTSWVGVQLTPSASGTLIAGNLIGLNAAGTAAIGNAGGGLYIESANNMIGGTTAASRNIISGNGLSGIDITGATATGNTVTGNYIGLNAAGTAAIANDETGVMIDTGASGNTIGGANASARNIISGNTQYGVIVTAQSGATANNIIQGNYLGTNAAGTAAISNGGFGVVIDYAAINTSILDNVISGNTNTSWSASRGGIYLYASGATIQGNKIGLDATGTATLGNGGGASSAGIFEAGGSSNVLIGGTGAGQGNTITGNAGPGVVVLADPGNIRMLGNAIYGNTGLGIDLGNNGVTINDAGDGDSGANNLQNFPVLMSATTNGSTIVVSGSFNSTASSYYRIEFFSSPSADSTGYGEGQTYLGYVNVSTNGSGNATFNTTLSASVAAGQYISATATQCNATYTTFTNTSEFAQNITSLAPNNAPSGTNKTQTILEDTNHTFSIADFGFADPGDSPGNNLLAVTITTLPTAGSLTLSGAAVTASQSITAADITAGKLVFQPAANANGAAYASFTFQVQDDGGTSNGGVDLDPTPNTFTFNVTAVNDAPILADTALSLTVAEDAGVPSGAVGSLVSAFTGGISDVDSGAVNGIALVASNETNGTWYYSTNGGTNWTTVGTVNAGSSLLLANNASTRLYFSPAANYNGSSSSALTFRAWDQTSGTAGTKVDTSTNGGTSAFSSTTDVIEVSVTPVNDAPVLTSNGGGATASVTAAENQTAVTTVTATDPDVGAVLTYSIAGGSDAGRFSIDANAGVLTFNFSPNFESTVDANADGVYEVIVAVSDGSLSDTQALSVTVTNVNETPTVVSLSNSTLPENTDTSAGTVVGSLTASDPDAADSTTYSIVGGADAGVFSLGGASSDQLVITHGVLDFETKSSYAVTVRVTDGGGLFHDQALLVSVSDVNEAPSFTSAALTTGTQDAAYSYTITTTDPDTGAVLAITAPTLPAWLTLTDHGDGTATLSGTPSNAEVGSHSVVLQVSDGTLTASQSFTIVVSDVNDPPLITSNGGGATASVTAAENQTAVTTVTATDPDVGAVLTYSIAGGSDAGRFSIDANSGVLVFNFSPNFESTVDANADGVYEVIVAVSDGSLSDTQALSVTVTNVNEAPTAGADTFTGNEDTSIIGNILSNDSDPDGDALNAVLVTGPSHGTLTLNGDGSFNYSAVANWIGNDSFSYQANDGTLNSAPTSVTLTVTPVNDSPVVSPITLGNLAEDNALLITQADLLAGASDVDGDALTAVNLALLGGNGALTDHGDGTWTFSPAANWSGAVSFSFAVSDGTTTVANAASLTVTAINDAPTSSPVTLAPIAEDSGAHLITQAALLANASDVDGDVLTAGNLQISAGNGSLIDNGDGTWTYMPTANDDTAVSFSYTITDNGTSNGAADPKSIAATANLDLIPVNDAPVSANGILNLAEDTPTSGQLPVASDAEGDPIVYALAAPASHGSVTVNADGSFDYLPAQNYNGSDSFMFSVSDNQGGSQNYRLDITVAPVNDAPTAANLVLNTQTNTVLNATLPAASDADGDPVSYGLVNPAGHGTVSVLSSGQFSYQPVANYSGPDSFTYSVSDGQGGTGAYSVTLNVSPAGAGIIVPPPPPPTEPSGSGPSTPGATSTPPADSGNEGRTTGPQTTQIVPGRADPAITSSNRNDVAVASIKVKSIEPVATLIETTPSRLAGSRENPAPWTTDDISLEFLWKPIFRTIGTSAHAADGRVDFQPGQAVSDADRMQWLLDITPAKAAGVTLSVGVVWWTLRAGGLLASLAASLPVWRGIDVTMILDDRPLAAGKNNNGRQEGGE